MRNKARRSLALILSVAMTVTLWKTPVYAVMESGQSDTGLCEHHTVHTEDCGYTEETPCRYVCEICKSQNGGENEQQPDTEDSAQKECSCTIRCTEGKVNTECQSAEQRVQISQSAKAHRRMNSSRTPKLAHRRALPC